MERCSRADVRSLGVWLGVAAATAATLGSAGCGDDGSAAGSSGAVAVERASETGRVEALPELEAVWLVPPDPAGEPPQAAPIGLGVDGRGRRLYVLETQPPELRIYSTEDGRYLGALGRAGDGPGEYRNPIALAVEPGGLVAVLSTSGRVTYWGPDGELAGTVQAGPGLASDVVAARADSFYVKIDLFPPVDVAEFRVAALDTVLARPVFRDSQVPGTEEPGRPSRNHSYAVAATPVGDILLAPPGPDYLILRIGRDGATRQTIGRPEMRPLRRSEAEIEALVERVQRAFAALGRPPPAELEVPIYRPHIAQLAVTPDAGIWALTQRGDSSVAVIDRFDPSGEFVASYAVRLRVSRIAADGDAIYFLARSDFNVPGIAVAASPDR